MMYWAKTNGIEIDTAVFFVKMEIEETVKTKFKPGGPKQCMKVQKVGFHH